MERRRFVPQQEGLERRALMASSPSLNGLFGAQMRTGLNIPITYQQKALRVKHLPYYLEKIRPGRYLPPAEVQEVQNNLMQVISKLQKPSSLALDNYNIAMRKVISNQSVSPTTINLLSNSFGGVLHAAAADPTVVNNLKSAMDQWVSKVDTASPEPMLLTANDYALVLQTALSIGRPMPPPALPRIAKNQGVQADPSHIKTRNAHPGLVGTYHFHTHIQIVTPTGVVVGTAGVQKGNRYRVKIQEHLDPGVYQFRIRAYDSAGNLSRLGPQFMIKVMPPGAGPSKGNSK